MAVEKKELVGDATRTVRAKAHLERLENANGKRLLVDLDAEGHDALKALLAAGYGETNKAVVNRARVAASRHIRKT